MSPSSVVSVIVPTKNSVRFLEQCVESIRSQAYPNVELVVVDDRSDDGTWELAQRLADIAIQGGPERCAQWNAGARVASGTYLYRVDADFVLDPRVIREAVTACERGADAVCVPNRSDPTVSFWSSVRDFERRMLDNHQLIAGARFFRASAFHGVGGFDESLVAGEDYDLNNRLTAAGRKIVWIAAEEKHLGEPRTLGDIARKSYYYGRTFAPFLRKSGRLGIGQISPFRSAYLRHWRDFLMRPTMAAGFAIMQSVKYLSGAAGLAAAMLAKRPPTEPT